MKSLNFFQIGKAYCSILAFVSKKRIFWLLSLFLSVVLAFSSCDGTGVIFFEIQYQKPPTLSFNKLVTSSRNISASDLLKQIPETEKKGFTVKEVVVKDSYKTFAQVTGTKSALSLNIKKEGTFTVKIVLEQKEYHDAVINDAEIELIIKKPAKVLTFNRLSTIYKSSLSKAEILGQVQGEKAGYTLKSITVSNTAFAQAAGTAPDISLTLKKVGTFTATIVLEHLRYEDATISSAAFEITKGPAKTLTFRKLLTDRGTVTRDEILRQIQGEKASYTLKSISSITPTSAATVSGTAPDLSLVLDTNPNPFTFTATIVLESPSYEDARIPNAEFEKGEIKFIFHSASKTIIGIRSKYAAYFSNAVSVTFPDQINGVDVEHITGGTQARGSIFGGSPTATSIRLPQNLRQIGDYVFSGCRLLSSITLPNSLENIGNFSFAHCQGLTSITLPPGLATIGRYAFSTCTRLTSIGLPNSVTSMGRGAFSRCSELRSVTLSNSLTVIDRLTFMQCTKLNSITIPDSVTTINGFAFARCTSLTAITLPDSVTTLDGYIFQGCTNLTVTLEQTVPSRINITSSDQVHGVYKTGFDDVKAIRVPAASLGAYQRAATWSKWAGKMVGY